jgi:hypothetical protein
MQKDDLALALDWALREGWNPGKHDLEPFFAADPQGYFLGLLDGKPIGSLSAVRYGNSYGFVGLFMVLPEHRGGVYGGLLARFATQHLEGRVIGLDGVVAMQASYKRAGFKLAHRNLRFETKDRSTDLPTVDTRPLTELPFAAVEAYDYLCFGERRPGFLQAWIQQPGTLSLAAWNGSELSGYGIIRPCHLGYKIGPLFADSSEIARSLFLALCKKIPQGEAVILDVPEANPAALALAAGFKMNKQFETARMYSGGEPALTLKKVFGITSFELG